MQNPPPPHRPPATPTRRWIISAVVALVVAAVWSIAQFTLSEILYKTSEQELLREPLSEFAFTLSNLIAWPAEPIYTSAEKRRIEAALAETLAEETVNAATLAKLRELADRGAVDFDHDDHFELYEILEQSGNDPSVPVSQEYLIYGGVCASWGALVGILAGVIAWNLQAHVAGKAR